MLTSKRREVERTSSQCGIEQIIQDQTKRAQQKISFLLKRKRRKGWERGLLLAVQTLRLLFKLGGTTLKLLGQGS